MHMRSRLLFPTEGTRRLTFRKLTCRKRLPAESRMANANAKTDSECKTLQIVWCSLAGGIRSATPPLSFWASCVRHKPNGQRTVMRASTIKHEVKGVGRPYSRMLVDGRRATLAHFATTCTHAVQKLCRRTSTENYAILCRHVESGLTQKKPNTGPVSVSAGPRR